MKRTLAVSLFVLATFTWAVAQNPSSSTPDGQQPPSASSQAPGASQSQSSTSGSAAQDSPGAQAPSQTQAANAPITEGCLGGSDGNYTLTDKAGTSYKLNFPSSANVSVLSSHVGEAVAGMGDVKDAGKTGQTSINVSKIGRGTSTCPASSSAQPQSPKK